MTGIDAEVLVAGGGPVGLVAAIEARLAGLEAIVLEPRDGPIDKACGEGLMPGAVPLLGRLGVAPHGIPLRGVRYTDGSRDAVHRFAEGGAVGLGVRRTTLHDALAARAAALGVRVEPVRVAEVAQDADGVRAAGLRGRWLLGADGLHSTVARAAGLARPAPRGRRRYGLREHRRVAPWSELIEVHWTPEAELYVTPVDDRLVGIAVLARQGVGLERALAGAPELAARLADAPVAGSRLGAGPFRQRTRARTAGRILLVGDASGYTDAITGEGLRLGFAQARAAVGAVAAGRPSGYEGEWMRITRSFRVLTGALAGAASSPFRGAVVPAASRLPRVFGAAVEHLAR
ncbi:NAD(P)/FAD-dependent oxidoreductase [Homoserinibacter sp. YIM 151385]|uniref:NAD(P)/FAD-dependent oxidoreductase n=1 Tax=Homoserinibacter sp. YIM 151385 TaxID=2985506 RepID=UPI0022EFDA21|nr:FAD-dependent monooxygenase [Homoserinibacter sp. YIM 151385]WBU37198.1 FAD-dependent monooxygenase [Homoserinibacter sp. YIM 151385]